MDNCQVDLAPWEDVDRVFSTHWIQVTGSPRLVSEQPKQRRVGIGQRNRRRGLKGHEDWDGVFQDVDKKWRKL